MKYKYGNYKDSQFQKYSQKIHARIHWLLIYAEKKDPILNQYFELLQLELDGLNELLNYPVQIVQIQNLIESARLEYTDPQFSYKKYRQLILDAHTVVDLLFGTKA